MSVTNDGDRETLSANDNGAPSRTAAMSGVSGFYSWWKEELAGILPGGIGGGAGSRADAPFVQEVDGQVVLKRKPGAAGKVLPMDPRKAAASLPRGGVLFLLPEDGALRRERRLPGASRAHISDIMNLQMASETPFTLEEVYTDAIVTGEDDYTREIMVSQALAPRAAINDLIRRMRDDYGMEIAAIDVADPVSPSGRAGFNLLPDDDVATGKGGLITLNRLLILGVVAAGLFAGMSWRDLQQRRIAAADTIIAGVEANASAAMKVKTQITNGVAGIQRLEAEDRQPLTFMKVYNLIAGLMPDGAWLEEFSYELPTAIVTGLAADSATLVQAMESSDLVQTARFVSPTVTDPRTGAERFRLEITFEAAAGNAVSGQETPK